MNKILISKGINKKDLWNSIQTQSFEEQDEEMKSYSGSMTEESEEARDIPAIKRSKGSKISRSKKKCSHFTLEEDQRLLRFVQLRGPKFQIIKHSFQGKSVSMLKNRYYKNLRYRWSEILGDNFAHLDCKLENAPYQAPQKSDFEEVENLLNNQPNLYPETKSILEQMLQGFVKVFQSDY